MGWLSKLMGKSDAPAPDEDTPSTPPLVFRALTEDERANLDRERLLVRQVADRELGLSVDLSPSQVSRDTLLQLQPLVDQRLVHADNLLLAQGLGVVLGDALCNCLEGLHWCMVSDAYGTDPVVRMREQSLQVAARDMVIKRLENGNAVDLAELLDGVIDHLKRLIDSGEFQ